MKKILFTVSISLFAFISSAQITFQKRYGASYDDYGSCGQQTSDGGYVIVGSTDEGTPFADVYLVKTDSAGALLWTKKYGGQFWDYGFSIQQTTDGGYIIGGMTSSFSTDTSNDIYLIRTDSFGDTLWTKTFGGTGDQRCYSVRQAFDGGYIIGGSDRSALNLIKTDAGGTIVWSKTYGYGEASSVQQTADSGYIVTGSAIGVANSSDAFLMKIDIGGTPLWSKTFGGIGIDNGKSVRQTNDGGYIIAGATNINHEAEPDVYLIRTNAVGDTLWTKTYGWTYAAGGTSVWQTTDGGFIITASISTGAVLDTSNVYLIKTDDAGDTLWTKRMGGVFPSQASFGQQTADGGYIIMGEIKNSPTAANDVYLIKTDANGNSGCNEGNIATIVTSPPTVVTTPATVGLSQFIPAKEPATIVGNGGIETVLCTNVGIDELSTDNLFLVSPNPFKGNFTIRFERIVMKGNIEILNTLGKNVFAANIFNESKKEINVKNIADGIYIMKVFDGEKYYCKKLIAERN